MRRLDRYVIKELFTPIFIGTVVIAMLFVANEFIAIFREINVEAIPLITTAQLVAYKTPGWLVMTLPVGMAIGTSLAITRLARDSELTAMRAAGIPFRRVLLPIIIIGIGFSAADWYLVEKVVPKTSEKFRRLSAEVAQLAYRPTFRPDLFIQLDNYLALFGSVTTKAGEDYIEINDVFLVERPQATELLIYEAKSGTYTDGVWRLENPVITHKIGNRVDAVKSQEEMIINQEIRISDLFSTPSPEEESAESLWIAISQARSMGVVPTSLLVSFYTKFSVPASCVIFALTGAVFAAGLSRLGPFTGLLVSLALVMLYYNIHVISTQILGKNEIVSPELAAWLPNIIYAALTLFALWRFK